MTHSELVERLLESAIVPYRGARREFSSPVQTSVTALFALLLEEKTRGHDPDVHARILRHLRSLAEGGSEPCMDARKNWSYPAFSASLALARATPSVWGALTDEEKSRLDLLMKCLLVITSFISNDGNNYKTGIGLEGDTNKMWNPNIQMSLVSPILFCASYFGGADAADAILTSGEYDEIMQELAGKGFCNILSVWRTEGFRDGEEMRPGARELLSFPREAFVRDRFGNVYSARGGLGAFRPYTFSGKRAGDAEIARLLLDRCYSGGRIVSRVEVEGYLCCTVGEEDSPYEGEEGLLLELNTAGRSDAFHAAMCFSIAGVILLGCEALGIWSRDAAPALAERIAHGNADLFFKLERGYRGVAMSRYRLVNEGNVSPDYHIMKELMREEGAG